MSDINLKVINDLTYDLEKAKIKLKNDILEYLQMDGSKNIALFNELDNIDKNDPKVMELNRNLINFKESFKEATMSVQRLTNSVRDISRTIENYQRKTCKHKFIQKQDFDIFNGNTFNYEVCDLCGEFNDLH